jgi:rhombotail lipoprotein
MHRDLAQETQSFSSKLEFSSKSVQEIEAIKPQLHAPIRLAVAPPLWRRDLHWTSGERAEIESWRQELVDSGFVSDFVLIPPITYELGGGAAAGAKSTFEQVREAAARHHADAVLVIRDVDDTSEWGNPLSILYATIVGCWVVPGTSGEAVSMMQGLVIDNRNEYLYASYESEGSSKTTKPVQSLDFDALRLAARVTALREMKNGILARTKAEIAPAAATGP